jgi:hypothetical protein
VDGELGPADHAAVEDWLLDHPADRAAVDADRRLTELMRVSAAPDPGEAAWAGVLQRIASAPPAPARRPLRRGRWIALAFAVAAGLAAAAVLLAVLPGKPVEPLPVASDDDIEIISMDGGDERALVVGQPPVHGPFLLASAGDVTVDDTGHDVDVIMPPDQGSGAVIIMPQELPPPPDKD